VDYAGFDSPTKSRVGRIHPNHLDRVESRSGRLPRSSPNSLA
jgi:hypothetical protein